MKNHKRLLVSQCKYTKTPMSKFECFGHAVKGQSYQSPKTFLRIGSYYKTTIDKLKIMNHLKLLTKYNQ